MITSGNYAYFTVFDVSQREVVLWRSDGTPEGTFQIVPAQGAYGSVDDFIAVGGRAFFSGYTVDQGIELWTSDGTPAGTHLAFDLNPGPDSSIPGHFFFAKGQLWFSADDGVHGAEPWVYDVQTEHVYLPLASGQ